MHTPDPTPAAQSGETHTLDIQTSRRRLRGLCSCGAIVFQATFGNGPGARYAWAYAKEAHRRHTAEMEARNG